MPSHFHPLMPQVSHSGGSPPAPFRVLPQAPGDSAAGSNPSTSAPRHFSPAATATPDHPQVTLEKEGDRISRIRIRCTCGQVIELTCDY